MRICKKCNRDQKPESRPRDSPVAEGQESAKASDWPGVNTRLILLKMSVMTMASGFFEWYWMDGCQTFWLLIG